MKNRLRVSAFALLFFILAACGGTGGEAHGEGIPVQVTETDFHIASSITGFVAGKSYHFIVTNRGKSMHELMLMPRSEGSMNGMAMEDMDKKALASIPMIDPGETRTLDYTFPLSAAGTHPELACYLPGHYEAGMKLAVVVRAA